MALSEEDTRAKLIDPALHSRGRTEDKIKREVTAGAIETVAGIPSMISSGTSLTASSTEPTLLKRVFERILDSNMLFAVELPLLDRS